MTSAKHESIRGFLARLSSELDPGLWTVVDHWEADRYAVGIARRGEPGVLVYVSTWRQPSGRYYCALERPPADGDDAPYAPAGDEEGLELGEVVRRIREHLSRRR